uniref:DUF3475 domain-containing protein n=1 Tax=Aegilops tauschii subsp. strangulata TaxID=200361 RepID=A0A453MKI7_AEGTS
MARESWLAKVRSAISSKPSSSGAPPAGAGGKKGNVGILAFEVASLVSRLLHVWRAVGDAAVARLRHEVVHLDGVRKVVSDDDAFLLGLARAELVDALRGASDAVAALAERCADPCLREFRDALLEFADTGRDRHRWAAPTWKEMDARARKLEKQVATTAALRRAMEELAEAEHGLRKFLRADAAASGGGGCHRRSMSASKISVASEQQQLIFSKKQDVKNLKQTSLWGCTFDAVVSSLARAAFTILARIKLVFGAGAVRRRAVPAAAVAQVHVDGGGAVRRRCRRPEREGQQTARLLRVQHGDAGAAGGDAGRGGTGAAVRRAGDLDRADGAVAAAAGGAGRAGRAVRHADGERARAAPGAAARRGGRGGRGARRRVARRAGRHPGVAGAHGARHGAVAGGAQLRAAEDDAAAAATRSCCRRCSSRTETRWRRPWRSCSSG